MAILESHTFAKEHSSTAGKTERTANERLLLLGVLLFFSLVVIKSAWLSDDAFITLRTVRNAVNGYGLVWNVGERVQAYTHPLWMLLLTLVYFVTRDAYYGTIFLSLVISILTAGLLVERIARSLTAALLALLLLSLSKAFIDYSTSGLENPLTHLLLALFVWVYGQGAGQRRVLGLTLVTALTLINRMDIGLILVLPWLAALWQDRSIQTLRRAGWGLLPFIGWELFSLLYYGFPFPNTAYAKLGVTLGVGELLQQGLFYLLHSLTIDPITLLTVALALAYPLVRRQWHLLPWALGIVLYLVYVVRIGGDFMSGRFLSAPFCAAVLLLTQAEYPSWRQPQAWLLLGGALLVGLLNPTQSPWLSRADYNVNQIDNRGIADERGHYYQRYGLLAANRSNRLEEQGWVTGTADPVDFIHCGIGMRGFQASPYTHLVDFCGLADALVARLPTVYDPNWRIGHPIRSVPLGYMGTLRTGQNQLVDPNLALLYDKLRLVTQGDLWDRARLREIWNFNRGRYDQLVDAERYRYPDLTRLTLDAPGQPGLISASLFGTQSVTITLNSQGVLVNLHETSHATHVDVGLDCDYCEAVFFGQNQPLARTLINTAPLQLGPKLFSLVSVPREASEHGFDRLRITPLKGATYTLTHLDLLDWGALATLAPTAAEVPTLMRLYYSTYYRATEPERTEWLALLRQQLGQATDNRVWQAVPLQTLLALLAVPDPALQAIIESHLPVNTLLSDAAGQPRLRYLGLSGSETVVIDGKRYLQLHLHFLVVTASEQEYTAWFHMQSADPTDDGEWMIYDYTPDPPIRQWEPGTLVDFTPLIELAPGDYELSFGFWTPTVRERLYVDQAADVYWVDLGAFTVKE